MDVPAVPKVKCEAPVFGLAGWNGMNTAWKLPDEAYTKERREYMWQKYKKVEQFEKENNFKEQSMMFLSDYLELINLQKELNEKGFVKKKEVPKREMIKFTRPIDFDDLNYVIDHYDYDPDDDVVNKYDDHQAEQYIRSLVVEYRKSVGKQI